MEQRFWSKVRRGSPEECWEWTAAKMRNGYGEVGWNGTICYAHRVAWELTHGKIPEGLLVRHKCRGKCVNPAHMELGTHKENNAMDTLRDGTRGLSLTVQEVREIKARLGAFRWGLVKQLAAEYGVAPTTISKIKRGCAWAEV